MPKTKTQGNPLPKEIKLIFKDAVCRSVWVKSPILHTKLDRQKCASAVALKTDLDQFLPKDYDFEANIANLVSIHAPRISNILN